MKAPNEPPKYRLSYAAFVNKYVHAIYRSLEGILGGLPHELTEEDQRVFRRELLILRFAILSWWLSQIPGFSFGYAYDMAVEAFVTASDLPQPERTRLSEELLDGCMDYLDWNASDNTLAEANQAEHYCVHFSNRLLTERIEQADAITDIVRNRLILVQSESA